MLHRIVNLAIADHQTLFGKTLKNYLSEQTSMHVPILASDMRDLFDKLKNTLIDILLIDLSMPGVNGLDALKTLRADYPSIKILVLSIYNDLEQLSDLLDLGILGYIPKSSEPEELLQAIQAVVEDRIYRSKLYTEALYFSKQKNIRTDTKNFQIALTDREKKILQLIWEEKSNKQIADALFIGTRSIEKIRQDMKEKIGAKSTVGLIKYGLKKKIINAGVVTSGFVRWS